MNRNLNVELMSGDSNVRTRHSVNRKTLTKMYPTRHCVKRKNLDNDVNYSYIALVDEPAFKITADKIITKILLQIIDEHKILKNIG